jgi:HK97 family phage prohead protease
MRPHLSAPVAVPIETKSIRPDGTFEGYASLFYRADLGHDVVLPGAFAESLRRRGSAGIKMLWQHDPAEPIGLWERVAEDHKGLFARGRLLTDVARGRDVLALMRAGAVDGLSIGFKLIDARRDARTGTRRIARVDLWEISIVTFPMLPEARVAMLRSSDPPLTPQTRAAAAIRAASAALRA